MKYWGSKLFGKEVLLGNKDCSINNIYQLEGRVPIAKAIPFGLQHILAMFVSNLAPITLIAAGLTRTSLSQAQIAILLQNAMFVPGLEDRIETSGSYGCQLYIRYSIMHGICQLRMPACNIILTECWSGGYDESCKQIYDHDRCGMYDPCRSASAGW